MPGSIERLVRSALRTFAPYKPGTSVDEVRRRYGLADPVKLSQNENPLGTSPGALAAVRSIEALSDYVEDDHRVLRERLARNYPGLTVENVVCGHGSNELISVAFGAFVDPGDDIVIGYPTFSLYRKDADIAGARTIAVPLRDGVHDLDAMLAAVTSRTKLVFVCDPNNPTSTRVDRDALLRFARDLREDVLLVIDQAYREYMDAQACEGVDVLRERPNTLVLRTASKIFGLAAVRFGYGYGSPDVIAWMNRVRVPFNVSRPAALAVLAALDDDAFIARSIALNEEGKRFYAAAFARLGLRAYPTAANFVAVEIPSEAETAYEALLARGVIVRSGDGLGLPRHLRVTIGTAEQNAAFVAALEALLPAWRAASVPAA